MQSIEWGKPWWLNLEEYSHLLISIFTYMRKKILFTRNPSNYQFKNRFRYQLSTQSRLCKVGMNPPQETLIQALSSP